MILLNNYLLFLIRLINLFRDLISLFINYLYNVKLRYY